MSVGTVKWFDERVGYGFIQPDDGTDEIIVRKSAVERIGGEAVREGQRVAFSKVVERRSGKVSAEELRPL